MVDHLQSRVTPWRQYASHVKVRGTLSKMDVVGFCRGEGGTGGLYHSNVFSLGSRRQNFGRESFLAFCSEFERHTLKDRLSRTLAHVKYVLSNGAQNRCQLCRKGGVLLQLFRTQINHWDKPDDGVVWAGKENKTSLKLV